MKQNDYAFAPRVFSVRPPLRLLRGGLMGAKFIVMDDVSVKTDAPLELPRAKILRRKEIQHRGRTIVFHTVDSTEAEWTALFSILAGMLKEVTPDAD